MKTRIFTLHFFFLFVTCSLISQPSWTMLTPTPQENTINCIKRIPGTDRLIAVCSSSTIMFSQDQGNSWQIIHNPAGNDNDYICQSTLFLNQNAGFISGSYLSILKTSDGGSSWNEVYTGSGTASNRFFDIVSRDQTTGIAVGSGGKIIRTTDGGNSWSEVISGVTFQFNAVDFCLSDKVIAVGSDENQIVVSYDSGQTWETETINPSVTYGILRDIKFVTNTTGIIAVSGSGESKILRSTDGGSNWDIVYSGYYSPRAIDNYSDMDIAVSCHREVYESGVLISQNGGLTWQESTSGGMAWNANKSIVLINDIMDFIIGGDMGVMFLSIGGLTWNNLFERTYWGDIYQVQFLDQYTGFALAESHIGGMEASDLMKTDDGGLTWNLCGGIGNYHGAFFSFSSEAYILAYYLSNLMLNKTTDEGLTWTFVNTGFDFEPYCIKFQNNDNGLITGEGYVIKTADSGETWQEVIPGGGWFGYYYDIEYRSANKIFLAGEGEYLSTIVAESNDSGNTWIVDTIGDYGAANDIFFVDENTAFLACQSNTILKSTDGGETWYETVLNNSNSILFKSISFPSQSIGYAVGDGQYETIVKTMDGGETWNPINSHSTSGLNCVHFFVDNVGLVFGEGGVVLKTTTGGITGFEEKRSADSECLFEVTPNPFTNYIEIRFNQPGSDLSSQLLIYDVAGLLIQVIPINASMECLTISTYFLKPGVYFYQIKTETGIIETRKMIKL